jgi:hypothetical protein
MFASPTQFADATEQSADATRDLEPFFVLVGNLLVGLGTIKTFRTQSPED